MNLVFLEKVLEDGSYEITIKSGAEELKKAIDGKFVFPKKMILTAVQREENKGGMRDLLTGGFCFQELMGVSFTVENEKGELQADYMRSVYDGLDNIDVPDGMSGLGAPGAPDGAPGAGSGGSSSGGCCEGH